MRLTARAALLLEHQAALFERLQAPRRRSRNSWTAAGDGWTVRAFSRVPTGRAVLVAVVVCF